MEPTRPTVATEEEISLDRLYRLTVKQYHAIARAGIIDEDEPVELLEGILVIKGCDPPPVIREDGTEEEDDGITLNSIYRLSVGQYHAMARRGILVDGEPVELLEGLLVQKMTKHRPHSLTTLRARRALERVASTWGYVDSQEPVTTSTSEPEPDVLLVRGAAEDYLDRQPGPADAVVVVEVADTSLRHDRGPKKRIYAQAEIPVYWIVNLNARTIEVYTEPSGPVAKPDYARREEYRDGDSVPVLIDGVEVGRINATDVLPPVAP
jgi:Uma2 family endonuclease